MIPFDKNKKWCNPIWEGGPWKLEKCKEFGLNMKDLELNSIGREDTWIIFIVTLVGCKYHLGSSDIILFRYTGADKHSEGPLGNSSSY